MTPESLHQAPLEISYRPADTDAEVLNSSIGGLLRAVSAEVSDRVALVSASPDVPSRQWTYQELLVDAEHAAHWLLERFSPGDHITVWSPNLPEWVVLQYGAALAPVIHGV